MSHDRFEHLGWFLVCKPKVIGTEEGRTLCSKDRDHRFNVFSDTNFCPICGSPVKRDQVDRYASFIDALDGEEYLGEELCKQLQENFVHIPIEENLPVDDDDYAEVLVPNVSHLFSVFDSKSTEFDTYSDYTVNIDPQSINTDFDYQRTLVEALVYEFLQKLYSDVDIRFGKVVYWS